jgi:PhnB protein
MKPYKPAGYNSVSPYIIVNGAQQLIDLLGKIFNARDLRRYDGEGGKIMHAEISIDDTVVMIADSSEQYPPNSLLLHVYVSDVDAVFAKAMAEGCQPLEQPKQREGDPDKRGMFQDFSGNIWAIGTQL